MKKLTDIKALELDGEATQIKFNNNWKQLGKEGTLALETFYELQEEILKPLETHANLKRRHTANGLITLKSYENSEEYKLAIEFSKLNWEPVCIDVGQQVRELRRLVEQMVSKN